MKINSMKHITKRGVVKRNPHRTTSQWRKVFSTWYRRGNQFIRVIYDDEMDEPAWTIQYGHYDGSSLVVDDIEICRDYADAKRKLLRKLKI